MKDQTMTAIRNYRNQAAQMQAELSKIDPGLKDNIQKERSDAVRQKYQGHLDANLLKIKQGRDYFEAARLRESDPLQALIKKAWQADDNRPGMAAVISAMETMSPDAQLSLAKELNSPVIALQAFANLQKMSMDPLDRMSLEPSVREFTHGFVDSEKIRECAEVELTCLETEFEAMRAEGAEPHKILSMGHRIDAMKRIIATGQLPKSERVDSLTHEDPIDRLNAAYQTR